MVFARTLIRLSLFLTLFVLFVPFYGRAAEELEVPDSAVPDDTAVKIAILPWKVNAQGDVDYLKRAILDMLSSRIGSHRAVELAKTHAVRDALGEYGPEGITDEVAEEVGEILDADYVLYGSLSIIGESLSLDAKLVDVKEGSVTPFYSTGTGVDSLVDMAEKLASGVLGPAGGVAEPRVPPGPTYTGKFEPKKGEKKKVGAVPEKVEKAEVEAEDKKKKDDFRIIAKAEGEEEEKKALWKSTSMKGLFKAFEVTDLDGDGRKELVLITKRDILISRVEAEGLKVLKKIEGGRQVENIAISSTAGDKGGLPVVYVSRLRTGIPSGQILEFKDNDFRITASGIPWFMRVVNVQGKGPQLIGQRFRVSDGFYGGIRVLERTGDRVKDVGAFAIDLPERVGLYDFELFDATGDGKVELVALDGRNRLRLYKRDDGKWEEYWKGEGFYGGSLNVIELDWKSISTSEREYALINGRFFYADLDGDGRTELIIKRNEAGGLLGKHGEKAFSFKKGAIWSLTWGGADSVLDNGFDENWRTKAVTGYIADFTVEDLDGDGTMELTMLVVEGITMFKRKPKSYLLSYSLF
jgi:hypothetical protein